MLFTKEVDRRIGLLHSENIDTSDKSIIIKETVTEGRAEIILELENPCIGFKKLAECRLRYFQCQQCADYVLFELVNNAWYLHIFELKRSVTSSSWNKAKQQFLGGLLNALCIAGYLGITIKSENVKIYTCYRNDKIAEPSEPIELRVKIGNREKNAAINDWFESSITINAYESITCEHVKVQLDKETGEGLLQLQHSRLNSAMIP